MSRGQEGFDGEGGDIEDREEGLTEEEEVSGRFKRVKQRSAWGQNEVPGAVLRHCPDSLARNTHMPQSSRDCST